MQQVAFQLIAVFTGAICGALFRYKLADRFDNEDFYYGTFTANTAACAVLAFSLMISIRDLDLSCLCVATLAGTMSTYASFAYQIAKDLQIQSINEVEGSQREYSLDEDNVVKIN